MPTLFKFIRDHQHLETLLRGQLKLTPVSELNDPSELLPILIPEEVKASLEHFRKHGYGEDDMIYLRGQAALMRKLAPAFQAINFPLTQEEANRLIRSSAYDDIDLLGALLERTANEISLNVGLFCLSKTKDSMPMWAHYANAARGLVLEFRDLHETFQGDGTGILYQPIPVTYERECSGVTFDPRSHHSIFFQKLEDWSYEQEVRVVLPLSDCKLSKNQNIHLFQIPARHIVRVYFGWRMPSKIADDVVAIVRAKSADVEVFGATISRGQPSFEKRLHP